MSWPAAAYAEHGARGTVRVGARQNARGTVRVGARQNARGTVRVGARQNARGTVRVGARQNARCVGHGARGKMHGAYDTGHGARGAGCGAKIRGAPCAGRGARRAGHGVRGRCWCVEEGSKRALPCLAGVGAWKGVEVSVPCPPPPLRTADDIPMHVHVAESAPSHSPAPPNI
eukprot:360154-Chlamydomonas_euryale.AAC.6